MNFKWGKYKNFERFYEDWAYEKEEIEIDLEFFEYLRNYFWEKFAREGLTEEESCFIIQEEIFEKDRYDEQDLDHDTYKGWETYLTIYKNPLKEDSYCGIYCTSGRYETNYDYEIVPVVKKKVVKEVWEETDGQN